MQQRANATNTDNQDGKGVSVSLELNYIKMSKPLTYEDLVSTTSLCFFPVLRQAQRAFRDLVEHNEAVNDRKLLVSCRFVASTPSSDYFDLLLAGGCVD